MMNNSVFFSVFWLLTELFVVSRHIYITVVLPGIESFEIKNNFHSNSHVIREILGGNI